MLAEKVLAAVVAASGLLAESVVLMALEIPSGKLVVKWLCYFVILGSFSSSPCSVSSHSLLLSNLSYLLNPSASDCILGLQDSIL